MTLSPLAAARRTDLLVALALAVELLLALVLLAIDGLPLTPALLAGAGVAGLAAWLVKARAGSATAAWGLSLLLCAVPVAMAAALPHRAGLAAALPAALSLLPMYRRWRLVAVLGLVLAAVPPVLGLQAQPGGALLLGVLMLGQTAVLAVAARQAQQLSRATFDVDFLVRAMGGEGAIRLDLGVLRAETDLGRRLKQAQERMAGMLYQVRQSAADARQAATALQGSSAELTQRSQHAGAELGAAAMTLTQIAVIVKESAEAAMAARDTAQAATTMAEQGGRTVGRMVEQMQAIDAASRRITDIIGVIESIAFQTNLLALNAAVEAARAGEQGRGFAVVAGEVRSLAQRSRVAAAEVKSLVENTVTAVTSGNALAGEAGRTISGLTEAVARVDRTFHTLSADTHEHAAGIEAIRDTMNELNAATQHNLQVAEQARAISDTLAAHAQALNAALAQFRLEGDGTAAAAAAAAAEPEAPAAAGRPAALAQAALARASRPAPAPAASNDNVEFF